MAANEEQDHDARRIRDIRELTGAIREAAARVHPQVQVLRELAALHGPLIAAPLVPRALAAAKTRAGHLRDLQETADGWAARDGGPEYQAAVGELQAALDELRQADAAALAAIDGIAARDIGSP